MSVKRGDVVLYSAFGRSLNAIVLSTRSGEVSHLGAEDEPLISVAFLDPYRETGLSKDKEGNFFYPAGRVPQVFIEHDVVHASHEFSEEFKRDKGISTPAQIASLRGHGEWSEYHPDNQQLIDEFHDRHGETLSNLYDAQLEASQQRARAEKAESDLAAANKQIAAMKSAPAPSPEPVRPVGPAFPTEPQK